MSQRRRVPLVALTLRFHQLTVSAASSAGGGAPAPAASASLRRVPDGRIAPLTRRVDSVAAEDGRAASLFAFVSTSVRARSQELGAGGAGPTGIMRRFVCVCRYEAGAGAGARPHAAEEEVEDPLGADECSEGTSGSDGGSQSSWDEASPREAQAVRRRSWTAGRWTRSPRTAAIRSGW